MALHSGDFDAYLKEYSTRLPTTVPDKSDGVATMPQGSNQMAIVLLGLAACLVLGAAIVL